MAELGDRLLSLPEMSAVRSHLVPPAPPRAVIKMDLEAISAHVAQLETRLAAVEQRLATPWWVRGWQGLRRWWGRMAALKG